MNGAPQKVAVFGSTGSIGRSALEIISRFPDRFQVIALVAQRNIDLLEKQIAEFKPEFASLSVGSLRDELKTRAGKSCRITSPQEIAETADYDQMLASITGFAGLQTVLPAIKRGKKIALANKESLVAAGKMVLDEAEQSGAMIVPVDSEHTAVWQLLNGPRPGPEVTSIILTASGGPFLERAASDFESITPEEALKHPRWKMGSKITLDSATLFNKALEVIEARWLFNLPPEKIEVVVHPQSIIHAMVNMADGSTLAHLSATDMKAAIAYALNYPQGLLPGAVPRLDFASLERLDFRAVDSSRFPAIDTAKQALAMGSAACAVLNSANEAAGQAFLGGRIKFPRIYSLVNDALSKFGTLNYSAYEDLLEIDRETKSYIEERI